MVQMERVLSSHVLDVGYADGELHVRYAPTVTEPQGPLVIYKDVPADVAEQVMGSPSIGAALHANVRGRFDFHYPERD